jgi:hypothetical protein
MITKGIFPELPSFTEAELESCSKTGDYRPILFEWYKYTGHVTNLVASIYLSSLAAKPVHKSHFGALIGLLNRCCRLMMANVTLSYQGLFGETTALIDRCIFESAVKVLWFCKQDSEEVFARFFAEGLKTEIALKAEIQKKIDARGGETLQIEARMLKSIARKLATSGMSDSEIVASKKLPDLSSMINNLGEEHLIYVVGQKIGSHHVHGTWPSLLLHYLDWDDNDGTFRPRDHNCSTHIDQYVFVSLIVLSATKAFCTWLMNTQEAEHLVDMLQSIEDGIFEVTKSFIGSDFSAAEEL